MLRTCGCSAPESRDLSVPSTAWEGERFWMHLGGESAEILPVHAMTSMRHSP
jgi:hypothetical protein